MTCRAIEEAFHKDYCWIDRGIAMMLGCKKPIEEVFHKGYCWIKQGIATKLDCKRTTGGNHAVDFGKYPKPPAGSDYPTSLGKFLQLDSERKIGGLGS